MKTVKIHVHLENEPEGTWRPVKALQVDHGKYLIPEETVVPKGEVWQFQPGTVVRCAPTEREEGEEETLLAVEKV